MHADAVLRWLALFTVCASMAGCAGPRQIPADGREGAVDGASRPDPGIGAALAALNDVCARRDVGAFMDLFEDGDHIVLVGSDAGEVFRGRAAVAGFVRALFALPFTFSFEMPDPIVHQRGDTAWVFVDGAMVHHQRAGPSRKVPYRITAVMARQGARWRWQLFSGSAPRPE